MEENENNLSIVKKDEITIPTAEDLGLKTENGIVLVPEKEFAQLMYDMAILQRDKELLRYGCFQICGTLGLTNPERTKMKDEVMSGEEGVFKNLIKSGLEIFGLFTKAGIPGTMGKKAQQQIKDRFAFIEKVKPALRDE